ncbi:MAG: 30S ribosomal protein S6 [Chloroflexota bacterium]
MRSYELMYIIRPDLDEEQTNAVIEKYKGLLETQGATVQNVEKWGKRRLAYLVKDQTEGFYVIVTFRSEAPAVAELDRLLKISDEVMKYLIIAQEE